MVRTHNENIWVGLTDRDTEGIWRFVTDNTFYEQLKENHLFPWATGEPNNREGNKHCACVQHATNDLDDNFCSKEFHGLCEIKRKQTKQNSFGMQFLY